MKYTKNISVFLIGFVALVTLLFYNSYSLIPTQKDTQRFSVVNKNFKSDTIQIVCLDFTEKNIITVLSAKIESFYHYPTIICEKKMPKDVISPIRYRYNANKIINFLTAQNEHHYRFVVGLTSRDICTRLNGIEDWGIFGLGSLDASGCISSVYRLKKGVSESNLINRLEKVVLHEIGHNHGLAHCISPYPCFMKAGNHKISEVDKEPMDICVKCKQIIKHT